MTMTERPDPSVEALKEGAWREVAAIDGALAAGRLDEAGWHQAMADLVTPAYLEADNPYAQAGHSGNAATWRKSRGIIAHALHRRGSFLDAGCASGILMESVAAWGREKGLAIEPYGLEIVPALADLARRRLPHWAERIHTGNVREWQAPQGRRFTFVLLRPDYAPPGCRGDMVRHALNHLLMPGGRLIVFVGNEEADERRVEAEVVAVGVPIGGRVERPHPRHSALRRRLFWVEAPDSSREVPGFPR